ncbi:MAG: hypothetical protein HLUCCX10_01895 [Algoriphagus marincola HL-49]|uniref:Uncharacterized protein n=1 Tax=Algoriphagus marincola HL-49 TaxID=1305737 RepID=A0A0N8KHF3_9BACT|nr:MAG: hypothetical protein HLUCCX10_01895 [Algoriphagus marincola HL-49]
MNSRVKSESQIMEFIIVGGIILTVIFLIRFIIQRVFGKP